MRLRNHRLAQVFHRASWSVIDQGLSAASNLLLSVIVARTLDAAEFGAFAIAFLIFGLLISVTRATIGQPLQITFAGAPASEWREAVRSAVAASLLLGAASGAVVAGVGLALGGTTGQALVVVGACMPGLLAQDTCRLAFFSSGRAKQAAANDGLWTALEFGVLGAMLALGVHAVAPFILAWGGTAAVAAVVGVLVLRAPPRFRGSLRWMLAQRGLTGYLLAEHVIGQGLTQVGILAVGVAATPADVGSLRGGQVLLGPLNVLVTATLIFGIPEIARRRTLEVRERQQFCWALSAAVTLVTAAYVTLALLLPDQVGRELFGDTWNGAQTVLLPLSALALAAAIGVGPGVTLYGMGLARQTFGLNLIKAPILLLTLTVGIWQAGVVGAAWALAATETVMLPLLFLKAMRAMRAGPTAENPNEDLGGGSAVAVEDLSLTGPPPDSAVLSDLGDRTVPQAPGDSVGARPERGQPGD